MNEFTDMKQFPSQLDILLANQEIMIQQNDKILDLLTKPKRRQNGSESVTSKDFDAFWSLYPRKVSKPAAVRAWNGLNLTQQHKATEVIPLWTKAWGNEAIRFVPHAATWLNGHRFDDAVEMAVPEPVIKEPTTEEGWIDWGSNKGIQPKTGESMSMFKARVRSA